MTYRPEEASQMIDELAKICDAREEWLFQLVWEGKGDTPTYPWPDMTLHLDFTDETMQTMEIMPFENALPETFAKVTLTGDGFYRTISRGDLEIVLRDFLTVYGSGMSVQ